MITPLLLLKQKLADLVGETSEARVWLGIRESLKMLDDAIDQQEQEDRAHREEIEALMNEESEGENPYLLTGDELTRAEITMKRGR